MFFYCFFSNSIVEAEISFKVFDGQMFYSGTPELGRVQEVYSSVDVDQAPGTYKIAAGASAFNDRITLYVEEGVDCGSLAVGEALDYAGRRYTLVRNDGVLALNIS